MTEIKNQNRIIKTLFVFDRKYGKYANYFISILLTISFYFTRQDFNKTKVELAIIKERYLSLVTNMVIYNRNYEPFPLPVWQKVKRGNKFVMQYVNPQYVKDFGHLFGGNQYNIIGQNNFDMFPLKDAQQYYENDIAVSITGKVLNVSEYTTDSLKKRLLLKVIKWRDIREKDTLVYGMVKEIIK